MSAPGAGPAQRLLRVEQAGGKVNPEDPAHLVAWRTTAEAALVDALGENHTFVKRFREIPWSYRGGLQAIGRDPISMVDELSRMTDELHRQTRSAALAKTRALLQAAAEYVADMH